MPRSALPCAVERSCVGQRITQRLCKPEVGEASLEQQRTAQSVDIKMHEISQSAKDHVAVDLPQDSKAQQSKSPKSFQASASQHAANEFKASTPVTFTVRHIDGRINVECRSGYEMYVRYKRAAAERRRWCLALTASSTTSPSCSAWESMFASCCWATH